MTFSPLLIEDVGVYVNYFLIALIKYPDKSNLKDKRLIWLTVSDEHSKYIMNRRRGIRENIMAEARN